MKKEIAILSLTVLMHSCSLYTQDLEINTCADESISNPAYSKAIELEHAMNEITKEGVPGIAMAVYSDEGWWLGAKGLAKIEDRTPMQSCHLQYLQSVAKTYMAVAVLKLYEQGVVDLDAPMTEYLPLRYSKYITDAEKISVRMLLNHTSGIPEYNSVPAYVSYLLQHPNYIFDPEDYLKYIKGKALDFEPGSKYSYRNTNYVLLAFMVDALSGDHTQFIADNIFIPLGLSNTFYRNDSAYLNYDRLVNTYWDRYGDGIVENVSQMQKSNVSSLIGDDGIVATPLDAVKFLKGLMQGELLLNSTLEEMMIWVNNRHGNPAYGLGLAQANVQGATAYGHTGGGLGAGCELYYFPEKNIYVFLAINLGTVTDSPLHEGAGKVRDKIYDILFR